MELGNKNRKEFGERLKMSRLKAGLTQSELAKLSNVFQVQISDWEKGKRKADSRAIFKLSKALNVSDNWLNLGDQGEVDYKNTKYGVDITIKHYTNYEPTTLSEYYNYLTNDDKHIINQLVQVLYTRNER